MFSFYYDNDNIIISMYYVFMSVIGMVFLNVGKISSGCMHLPEYETAGGCVL
jgi:hypothetical protein